MELQPEWTEATVVQNIPQWIINAAKKKEKKCLWYP